MIEFLQQSILIENSQSTFRTSLMLIDPDIILLFLGIDHAMYGK